MGPKRKKTNSSTTTTHLVFQEGNSNKFWKITIDGTSTIVNYGKVGTAGQTSTKEHKDAAAAEKFATKEIAGKKKKGYNEAEANTNSTSEKPSKVAKTAQATKTTKSSSTRHWIYIVRHMNSGCTFTYEIFTSKKAYNALPENIRQNNYGSLEDRPPFGVNVVETLHEAKKRLNAIFKCGSEDKVMEAHTMGKINVGRIYDPTNFIESTKSTSLFICELEIGEPDINDTEFLFVFNNSKDYNAFCKYFYTCWDKTKYDWLQLQCHEGTNETIWNLKKVKATSDEELGYQFNN